MDAGQVSLASTVLSFLLFGFSRQTLWFHLRGNAGKKKAIIASGDHAYAWRCKQCCAVLIQQLYFDGDASNKPPAPPQ